MSFDALTISGMLAALLSGGFLVGVARHQGGRWAGRWGGRLPGAPRRPRSDQDTG